VVWNIRRFWGNEPRKGTDMDCIFCAIRDGEIPSPKLFENEYCFAIRDIHPQAKEHILFIAKTHVKNVAEAMRECPQTVTAMMQAAVDMARDLGLEEGGYRLVTNLGENGCQSVKHLHIHLLGGEKLSETVGK